jgi:hypothetical protein
MHVATSLSRGAPDVGPLVQNAGGPHVRRDRAIAILP